MGLFNKLKFWDRTTDQDSASSVRSVSIEKAKPTDEEIKREKAVHQLLWNGGSMYRSIVEGIRLKTKEEILEELSWLKTIRNYDDYFGAPLRNEVVRLIYVPPKITEFLQLLIDAKDTSEGSNFGHLLDKELQKAYDSLERSFPDLYMSVKETLKEAVTKIYMDNKSWTNKTIRDFLGARVLKPPYIFDYGPSEEIQLTNADFDPVEARMAVRSATSISAPIQRPEFRPGKYRVATLHVRHDVVPIYLLYDFAFDGVMSGLELYPTNKAKYSTAARERSEIEMFQVPVDVGHGVVHHSRDLNMGVLTQQVLEHIEKFMTPTTHVSVYRAEGMLNIEFNKKGAVLILSDQQAFLSDPGARAPVYGSFLSELYSKVKPPENDLMKISVETNTGTKVTWFVDTRQAKHDTSPVQEEPPTQTDPSN